MLACQISGSMISGTTSRPSCCARPATSSWCSGRSTTADIKMTARYAHVLDEEIAAGVESVAESREKPRVRVRKVS